MSRRFYVVWLGQLLSGLGSDLTGFGAAFWVFAETGSIGWLAVMFGATAVPRLAVTPLLGLVDRLNRRVVMMAADTGAALATMVVIVIWVVGELAPSHLVVSTLVGSTFGSLQRPAYSAAMPTLVDSDQLDRANGLTQLGPGISAVVVPGLAGALVAWVGIGSIFIIDLVTFAVGIATVAAVRFGAVTDRQVGESFRLTTAVRWLRSDGRPLAALTLVLAGMNVALAGVGVTMVARAEDLAGEAAVGLGPTAGGVGMIVVSLVLGAWGTPRKRRIPAVGVAIVGFGLLLAASVAAPSLLLFVVCVGLAISTMPFLTATLRTIFQQWIPDRLLGRVFGILGAVTTAAEPLGLLLAVPLVGWSIAGSMVVAGATVAVLGTVVAWTPLLRPLNHPPATKPTMKDLPQR